MPPRPLPYPEWNQELADQLRDRGSHPVGQTLVSKPRRHYCVTYSCGTKVAYVDSPSKITGDTEAKPGLTWWAAGLAADYLLDNIGECYHDLVTAHSTPIPLPEDVLPSDVMARSNAVRQKWYAEARKQHDQRKTKAGDIGSQVHDFIERALKSTIQGYNVRPDLPDGAPEAVLAGIAAFESWWRTHELQTVAVELPVCHPGLGYAGTIDVMAFDPDGFHVIVDWKTSNSIHASYFRQVGAYSLAWQSAYPNDPVLDAFIVRLGKEGEDAGKFEVHHLTSNDLDTAEQAFVQSLHLARYTRTIEARIKG